MSFLDIEGLRDEDMLIYDDDAEEGVLQGPDEDMMPEGGDEDVPTPGQGWANYHAADGCKCGTFELKPCGACNKDVGRRHLCPVCHCHMHVPIEGLCEPADGIRGKSQSEDDSGDYAVFCPKHTPGRAGGQDQAPKRRRKGPTEGAGDLDQPEGSDDPDEDDHDGDGDGRNLTDGDKMQKYLAAFKQPPAQNVKERKLEKLKNLKSGQTHRGPAKGSGVKRKGDPQKKETLQSRLW